VSALLFCPFCRFGNMAEVTDAKATAAAHHVLRCDRCPSEIERPNAERGEPLALGPPRPQLTAEERVELAKIRRVVRPGYEVLAKILDEALDQAQNGKGHERHVGGGETRRPTPIVTFAEQRMVRICEALGSSQHAIGQALKKLEEALVLPMPARRRELLGAIIYAAGAVLVEDRTVEREKGAG